MTPDLPEELTLFHDVHHAHRTAVLAALARQGLQEVGQPKVLLLLSSLEAGSVTQNQLARAIHVTPATMSASLKSLERLGYVTKQSDEKDARRKRIAITQKGLDAVQRVRDALKSVDDRLFAGFTPEEVERIKADHLRMRSNLYAVGGRCPQHPLGKDDPK